LAAKKPFDVFKERFAAHLKNVLMKRPKSELKEAVCEWYLADALRRSHGFSHVKPQRQLEHEHKIGHPLTADLYLETWDQGRLVRCILELKWGGKISTATRLRDAILQGEKYGREIFADGGPRTRDVIVAVYVEDNGQGAIAVHVEIKEV
jgi:hypothetical protein